MKLVLIGFMGSGKSTIGALLAERLKYSFIDMDTEISASCNGRSIREIIEQDGEPQFRACEQSVAEHFAHALNTVIATGGGAPIRPETLEALQQGEGILIFLSVSLETIIQRLSAEQIAERPLFSSIESAKELYEYRMPLYRNVARYVVDCDTSSAAESCDRILSLLQHTQ